MAEGDIHVDKTSYGCTITDVSVLETVAIELEDVPQLIRDLQELLPFDFNEVAMPPPDPEIARLVREAQERGDLYMHDHTKPMFTLPLDDKKE